ncbi:MAG: N(5)-(carboxyethyl)ornithine synthase [Planctomycetes bacterium]|nr:N(5)-(carboxyethyl)ornithine synthase [Planctomycetota bacterium]
MQTIGFAISRKENEKRRALLPHHLASIRHRDHVVFETGYGDVLGISDDAYAGMGARIASRAEVYRQPIVCPVKAPVPEERTLFGTGQGLFGWIHVVQGIETCDFLVDRRMTAVAWEDMYEGGRHSFWRNNELAGEAAVLHAFLTIGRHPRGCRAAIVGIGNVGRGALHALLQSGADVRIYDSDSAGLLRDELDRYDCIVNAVKWDVLREDHLVDRADLVRMRRGSLIIDVSCDPEMGIETSRSTTFDDPIYEVDGVFHYAVDHTPTLFHRTATESIGDVVCRFADDLIEGRANPVLESATVVREGVVLDPLVGPFRERLARRRPAGDPPPPPDQIPSRARRD